MTAAVSFSSGYENAPATKLLAVYCACCGKELLDAKSVEAGMGPHCRKKHGYQTAEGEADWTTAIAAVATAVQADQDLADLLPLAVDEARSVANRLVHRVAVKQDGLAVSHLVCAIAALGFAKLAARIGERVGSVRVEANADGSRSLFAQYKDDMPRALRYIGAFWRRDEECWIVPAGDRAGQRLMGLLREFFPKGTIVRGSKATVVL